MKITVRAINQQTATAIETVRNRCVRASAYSETTHRQETSTRMRVDSVPRDLPQTCRATADSPASRATDHATTTAGNKAATSQEVATSHANRATAHDTMPKVRKMATSPDSRAIVHATTLRVKHRAISPDREAMDSRASRAIVHATMPRVKHRATSPDRVAMATTVKVVATATVSRVDMATVKVVAMATTVKVVAMATVSRVDMATTASREDTTSALRAMTPMPNTA